MEDDLVGNIWENVLLYLHIPLICWMFNMQGKKRFTKLQEFGQRWQS